MNASSDILIIGAGAAGLMAAYQLKATGRTITILEADDRIGGRIHTLREGPFAQPAELGAEFIHGRLPLTLSLLEAAGIPCEPMKGEQWMSTEGRLHREEEAAEHWPLLMKRLDALEQDCSILEFLEREFPGERYAAMRQSVIRFTEGYDAAAADKASAFALREEWKGEEETQYRITGGYGRLVQYLYEQCAAAGLILHRSAPVRTIQWSAGSVTVHTSGGPSFTARKVIITLPLAIWQLPPGSEGAVQLQPAHPELTAALRRIGVGHVIKFLLQFREPFWTLPEVKDRTGQDLRKLSFLLSDAEIPTWWTQYPAPVSLLTGWLGGPIALARKEDSKAALLASALASLARIFRVPTAFLEERLAAWEIVHWSAAPFARGAYAYAMVETPEARLVLNTPLADTVYFAGEALYEGPAMGTVEAALCSGRAAAQMIIDSSAG